MLEPTSLLDLDEASLFELLGQELLEDGRGVVPEDPDRRRRFAESWFATWMRNRRADFCGNPVIVELVDNSEDITDLTVLMDVLAPLANLPSVATLAAIVAKRGLRRICQDDPPDS